MMIAIPWNALAEISLSVLIDKAGKLFRKADASAQVAIETQADESAGERLERLVQRIEQLEALEAEQAKLIQQTLEELQKVAVFASGLQARANAAVMVSALAVIGCVLTWIAKG